MKFAAVCCTAGADRCGAANWRLIGARVRVEVTAAVVRIFHAGTEVARHDERRGRRERVLDPAHLVGVIADDRGAPVTPVAAEGRLEDRLAFYAKPKLLIVDELGYLPFAPDAAHLFFQLVSKRYERGSLMITSNRSVGDWGTVFGDPVALL
jgi:hypothetical protein